MDRCTGAARKQAREGALMDKRLLFVRVGTEFIELGNLGQIKLCHEIFLGSCKSGHHGLSTFCMDHARRKRGNESNKEYIALLGGSTISSA